MKAIWLLVLLVSAALAIASAPWALNLPWLNFAFKPLATLAVIGYAWGRGEGAARTWVLVGLLFSLAGDIALLWPKEGFLPGLIAFLLAHLAYLVAFTRVAKFAAWPLAFVVYALVAGTILWQLWPGVPGALRIPVVAYVACLAAMAAQAAVVWRTGTTRSAASSSDTAPRGAVLALGGALFVASDALLATNKFMAPLPAASLWILATYWAAQWCIASWLERR